MRTLVLSIICAAMTLGCISAQDTVDMTGFVFPEFTQGDIILKNGNKVMAPLNYDALYQRMILRSREGRYHFIGDVPNVALVVIDGRKFIPAGGDVFYEEVPLADAQRLYVRHRVSSVNRKGSVDVANGAISQAFAIENVGHIISQNSIGDMAITNSGQFFMGKNPNFEVMDKTQFFILHEKRFKLVASTKNLISVFGHRKDIKSFAKDNKINFLNVDDVKSIVEYCYSL